jgi:hypothetical protein
MLYDPKYPTLAMSLTPQHWGGTHYSLWANIDRRLWLRRYLTSLLNMPFGFLQLSRSS